MRPSIQAGFRAGACYLWGMSSLSHRIEPAISRQLSWLQVAAVLGFLGGPAMVLLGIFAPAKKGELLAKVLVIGGALLWSIFSVGLGAWVRLRIARIRELLYHRPQKIQKLVRLEVRRKQARAWLVQITDKRGKTYEIRATSPGDAEETIRLIEGQRRG